MSREQAIQLINEIAESQGADAITAIVQTVQKFVDEAVQEGRRQMANGVINFINDRLNAS